MWAPLLVVLVGCAPEVGSEGWCDKMTETPQNEWSPKDAASFLKSCDMKKLYSGHETGNPSARIGKAEPLPGEKIRNARVMMENLRNALDMFRLDVGRYPTSEEGLAALKRGPSTAARWSGPYLRDELPTDPWGRPFLYRSQDDTYTIGSYGEDGREGGAGPAADIQIDG